VPVYKGWNAKIFKDGVQIGSCSEVTIDIDSSLKPYYPSKSRIPAKILEGGEKISAKIKKLWIDTDWLQLVSGSNTLTDFDLSCTIYYGGSSQFSVTLHDCKVKHILLSVPLGFITEDVEVVASSLSFS